MEKYYLWLLLALGEGAPEITQLIGSAGSPEAAYEAFRANAAPLGAELAERAEQTTLESAEKLLAEINKLGIKMITIDSPQYPALLKEQENPPCVLFAYGNTELLKRKLLTIVGSRAVTGYTRSAIPRIISELGRNYAAVSSLSEGCDQLTCLNALKYDVPFIEVMPCGVTQTYPKGSRTLRKFLVQNGGLLITECLPKTHSSNSVFLRRSRIIGGISAVTLVLQAGAHSGALATAEYSRAPVFLPPNDIFKPEYAGVVSAVRKGCKLYYGQQDIEAAFKRATEREKENAPGDEKKKLRASPAPKPKAPAQDKKEDKKTTPAEPPKSAPEESDFESEKHRSLYLAISGLDHPAAAEELIGMTGFDAAEIAELLLDLELSDMIVNTHNRYTVT
ncbi:MAG: DNA-protecting protein DprA [Ruminiclostridium sp.]|nr:DNA-protecting protein DprA [Ruminiclostridium sp.]